MDSATLRLIPRICAVEGTDGPMPSTKEQYKDKKNGIISAKCAGIQVANSQKKSVQP
jgi:hypothetical protein